MSSLQGKTTTGYRRGIKLILTESEFNEYRFKSSAGLNLETLNTILSGTNYI